VFQICIVFVHFKIVLPWLVNEGKFVEEVNDLGFERGSKELLEDGKLPLAYLVGAQ
jgi:hypothetical protein